MKVTNPSHCHEQGEEIGALGMPAWAKARMDSLCEVTSSKRIFAADYIAEGVPFYRGKEIGEKHHGNTTVSTELFISREKFELIRSKFGAPKPGDLLLTSIGALLGLPYVVKSGEEFYFKDGNLTWFRNLNGIDSAFLYYWMLSPLGNCELQKSKIGSAQPAFTINLLKQMEIELPPLPVQRRIAGILSAYDELIENSQRRIRILEAMARALYREWFVHYRFPGHEKIARVFHSPEKGEIPKGWSVRKFGEVANITMGLSPKGDTYNDAGDGTPLINGPVEFGERFTQRVKWTSAPTKLCEEGDLVVCVRGSTTGKYVRSDGVYCLGRGVCGIHSLHQCFVDQLFESELPTLLGQTSGSTFPSWTGPQLYNHPVLCPPSELLTKFEALVRPNSADILCYSRQIQNLRRTRDLLLPRLLSGQVVLT